METGVVAAVVVVMLPKTETELLPIRWLGDPYWGFAVEATIQFRTTFESYDY
jgi:hypothetical protein